MGSQEPDRTEQLNSAELNQNWQKNKRTIVSKEIELIIFKIPTKESPGLDNFTGEFCLTMKELTPKFHKYFQKKKKEYGTLPNLFYEANIILICKSEKKCNKTAEQYLL